jgi:hypothetical protein
MDRMQIEFCIDAFVQETGYIPMAARSVRDAGQLSPRLLRFVQRMPATAAWRAWIDADRGWFVQGKLSDSSEDRPDRPTVYLIFRDHDARPMAAGIWCRSAPARWDLLQLFTCHAVLAARSQAHGPLAECKS